MWIIEDHLSRTYNYMRVLLVRFFYFVIDSTGAYLCGNSVYIPGHFVSVSLVYIVGLRNLVILACNFLILFL